MKNYTMFNLVKLGKVLRQSGIKVSDKARIMEMMRTSKRHAGSIKITRPVLKKIVEVLGRDRVCGLYLTKKNRVFVIKGKNVKIASFNNLLGVQSKNGVVEEHAEAIH